MKLYSTLDFSDDPNPNRLKFVIGVRGSHEEIETFQERVDNMTFGDVYVTGTPAIVSDEETIQFYYFKEKSDAALLKLSIISE